MTKGQLDRLRRLRQEDDFQELSVESLVYEAIRGSTVEEVREALRGMERDLRDGAHWLLHDWDGASPVRRHLH